VQFGQAFLEHHGYGKDLYGKVSGGTWEHREAHDHSGPWVQGRFYERACCNESGIVMKKWQHQEGTTKRFLMATGMAHDNKDVNDKW